MHRSLPSVGPVRASSRAKSRHAADVSSLHHTASPSFPSSSCFSLSLSLTRPPGDEKMYTFAASLTSLPREQFEVPISAHSPHTSGIAGTYFISGGYKGVVWILDLCASHHSGFLGSLFPSWLLQWVFPKRVYVLAVDGPIVQSFWGQAPSISVVVGYTWPSTPVM